MTARIVSGSSAVTAPRRERPHLGASQGRGWGTGGHCSQRAAVSPASDGGQSRRASAAHAELHMSAHSRPGNPPFTTPTCDQPYVYVRTPRSLSTSASTESSRADGRIHWLRKPDTVGPSTTCPPAREACIPNRSRLARDACIPTHRRQAGESSAPVPRWRSATACILNRHAAIEPTPSPSPHPPSAGACEPATPHAKRASAVASDLSAHARRASTWRVPRVRPAGAHPSGPTARCTRLSGACIPTNLASARQRAVPRRGCLTSHAPDGRVHQRQLKPAACVAPSAPTLDHQ
jgi:hypothetical protein